MLMFALQGLMHHQWFVTRCTTAVAGVQPGHAFKESMVVMTDRLACPPRLPVYKSSKLGTSSVARTRRQVDRKRKALYRSRAHTKKAHRSLSPSHLSSLHLYLREGRILSCKAAQSRKVMASYPSSSYTSGNLIPPTLAHTQRKTR